MTSGLDVYLDEYALAEIIFEYVRIVFKQYKDNNQEPISDEVSYCWLPSNKC